MKRATLATILCVLFIPTTYAQQQNPSDSPASKEDVMRYLDAMHTRDMMMSMMNLMAKQTSTMVHDQVSKQQDLPPDAEARINKMTQDMFKNFPVDDLLQAMVPVYQKHFTKGDIDALVTFYSSPAGQKLIKELPAITAESMQASMGVAQKLVANMQQQIQDDINQIRQQNKQGLQ
jgi:hypothetical protein